MSNICWPVNDVESIPEAIGLPAKFIGASLDDCAKLEAELQKAWVFRKDETDFSVYQHPNYWSNLVLSYCYYSSKYIDSAIKKILYHYQREDARLQPVYEDYPGFGLSTLHLRYSRFENVDIFNDVETQVKWMRSLFAYCRKTEAPYCRKTGARFKMPNVFKRRPIGKKQ